MSKFVGLFCTFLFVFFFLSPRVLVVRGMIWLPGKADIAMYYTDRSISGGSFFAASPWSWFWNKSQINTSQSLVSTQYPV